MTAPPLAHCVSYVAAALLAGVLVLYAVRGWGPSGAARAFARANAVGLVTLAFVAVLLRLITGGVAVPLLFATVVVVHVRYAYREFRAAWIADLVPARRGAVDPPRVDVNTLLISNPGAMTRRSARVQALRGEH
jgi:hypothetical protein